VLQYCRAPRYYRSRPFALLAPSQRSLRNSPSASIPGPALKRFALLLCSRLPSARSAIHPFPRLPATSLSVLYPCSPASQQPRMAANRGPRQAVLAGVRSRVPPSAQDLAAQADKSFLFAGMIAAAGLGLAQIGDANRPQHIRDALVHLAQRLPNRTACRQIAPPRSGLA
jgi:hypothetical protein